MNTEITTSHQTLEPRNDLDGNNSEALSNDKKDAIQFTSIRDLSSETHSSIGIANYLQFYLCLAIIFNFGLLFWDGNGGDIGFWEDWVKQLSTNGYQGFNGNYPPIYIHWLHLVGQFYNYLQIPVENNLFLKYLSQIPILLSHLILIGIVYQILKRFYQNTWHFHSCMLLTALNPALFLNGPIWGQIDVIPLIPVLLAILVSTSARYRIFTFPLYTLALLTKFQMIAFAPVMGIIFFRHYKIHLIGCAISLAVIALAFLPSMIAGNFTKSFKLAYIDVLHQYGATTMGAANIWILLTGNAAPDTIILFGVNPDSPLAILFKAKNFGMISFFLVCLAVFLQGLGKLVENKLPTKNPENASQLFFYGMICTAAFFTLLPAMHERYLLPAVIASLIFYALNPGKIIYPLVLSFISAFNVAMCLGIKTASVWPAISWAMVAIFFYVLLELLFGKHWISIVRKAFNTTSGFKYAWLVVLMLGLTYMTHRLYNENRLEYPSLQANQLLLVDLPVAHYKQDYGQLNINKSVNGNRLTANKQRYAIGLGTHANSVIEYKLPANSKTLSLLVALDDEVESASVKFSVWDEEKLLWESKNHYGAEEPEAAEIDVTGVAHLRLRVDGLNDISGDHANWLSPVLTLDTNSGASPPNTNQ
jgi:Gpi18-like mannosyltransferase